MCDSELRGFFKNCMFKNLMVECLKFDWPTWQTTRGNSLPWSGTQCILNRNFEKMGNSSICSEFIWQEHLKRFLVILKICAFFVFYNSFEGRRNCWNYFWLKWGNTLFSMLWWRKMFEFQFVGMFKRSLEWRRQKPKNFWRRILFCCLFE